MENSIKKSPSFVAPPETVGPESESRTPVVATFEQDEKAQEDQPRPSDPELLREKAIKKDAAKEANAMSANLSEKEIDKTLADSFPASDPPSH